MATTTLPSTVTAPAAEAIVATGRLLPFGHPATLTTTVERGRARSVLTVDGPRRAFGPDGAARDAPPPPRAPVHDHPAVLRGPDAGGLGVTVLHGAAAGAAGAGARAGERRGRSDAWPWTCVEALDLVSPAGTLAPNPALGHLAVPSDPAGADGADGAHGGSGADGGAGAPPGVPFVVRYRASDAEGGSVELALPAFFAADPVSDLTAALAWASRPAPFRTAVVDCPTTRLVAIIMTLAPGTLAPRVTSIVRR